jgi:RNA polymerase sigma-70 factor, ECF subfamily
MVAEKSSLQPRGWGCVKSGDTTMRDRSIRGRENQVDQEQAWLDRARGGSKEAFSRLVEAYQTPVYNLAYRMLGNRGEAEEAAQETFLRAYTQLHRYNPAFKFSTWMLSIASNHCIDILRKRRIIWLSLDEPLPGEYAPQLSSNRPDPERATEDAETERQVRALLDELQPDYRAAVILRYWYELPYDEIASAMDTTVSAVKSRLFRARKMLAAAAQEAGLAVAESV